MKKLPAPAKPPNVPYYAVIFVSQRTEGDEGYAKTADRMLELASQIPGFLGADSTRNAEGFGITVSYWQDERAIALWKEQGEHRLAQTMGKERWYAGFSVHVAKVERAYHFAGDDHSAKK